MAGLDCSASAEGGAMGIVLRTESLWGRRMKRPAILLASRG